MEIMIVVFIAFVYKMMPNQFFRHLRRNDDPDQNLPFKLTKKWLRNEGKQMWLWLRHMVQDVNESWGLLRGLHNVHGTCACEDEKMNSIMYDYFDESALGKNVMRVRRVNWLKGIVEYVVMTEHGHKLCSIKLGKAILRQIAAHEEKATQIAWTIYERGDAMGCMDLIYFVIDLQREHRLIKELKNHLKEFEQRNVELQWRISADPADLFTMSHHRPWHSCQDVQGVYRAGVFADVAAGSAIMFFYRPGQKEPCGRRLVRLAIKDGRLALKLYHGYGTTGLPAKNELMAATSMDWMYIDDRGWQEWITAPELLEYQGGYSAYMDGGRWVAAREMQMKIQEATTDIRVKISRLSMQQCELDDRLRVIIRSKADSLHMDYWDIYHQFDDHPLMQQIQQLRVEEERLYGLIHATEMAVRTEHVKPLVVQIRLLAFQNNLTDSEIEFPIDQMAKNLIDNENFWKLRERDKFTIKYLKQYNGRDSWNSSMPF